MYYKIDWNVFIELTTGDCFSALSNGLSDMGEHLLGLSILARIHQVHLAYLAFCLAQFGLIYCIHIEWWGNPL